MTRPFRFSAMLGNQIPARDFESVVQRTEELGYSALYFPDHFMDAYLAPMAAMAWAAGITSTLRIGSCMLDNDYKHPAVVAKEIATIDTLSGGRTELGIGAGWLEADYAALGLPYDRAGVRIERLAEALDVIRGCHGNGPLTYGGEHYTITAYDAFPKPAQDRIPVLMGGGGRRMLRLAGREADIVGINPNLRAGAVTEDALADSVAEMTDHKIAWVREGAGDRFDDLELQIRYFVAAITHDRRSMAALVAPAMGVTPDEALDAGITLVGTVGEVCDLMQARRDRWCVSHAVIGADQIEDFAPVVERLAGR